jgi:hypothetical protein
MAVKLSALRAGRALPPGRLKKSNDLIWNRSRDLPASSVMPPPTTLPCAPSILEVQIRIFSLRPKLIVIYVPWSKCSNIFINRPRLLPHLSQFIIHHHVTKYAATLFIVSCGESGEIKNALIINHLNKKCRMNMSYLQRIRICSLLKIIEKAVLQGKFPQTFAEWTVSPIKRHSLTW